MEPVKIKTVRNNALFTSLCGELLESGRTVRFQASGASMGEAVRHGDTVCVAPTVADEITVGDILLARPQGQWTAHRIVHMDKNSGEITLCGDENTETDQTVNAGSVAGRVVAVEREAMWPRFVRRTNGRFERIKKAIFSTNTIRRFAGVVFLTMIVMLAAIPVQASTLGDYVVRQDGIYTLNGTTGAATQVYNGTPFPLVGNGLIAQRVSDNMIFIMDWSGTVNNLYQWNPSAPTKAPVLIGAVTVGGITISSIINQLTFQFTNNTDTLYAITPSSTAGSAILYKVNTVTAVATSAATLTIPTTSLTITNATMPAPLSPVTLPYNVATITTNLPHGLAPGQSVTIAGVGNALFNGIFTIVATPTPTTFTYNVYLPNVGAATVGGTANNNVVDNTSVHTYRAQTIANSGGIRTAGVMTITTTANMNAATVAGNQMTITSMSDATFQEVCTLLVRLSNTQFTCNDPPQTATSAGGTVTGYLTGNFAFAPSGTLYLADRSTLYTVPLVNGTITSTGSAINGFGSGTENVSSLMFDVIGRALVQTINTNGTSNDQVYVLNYPATNSLSALTTTMGKISFGGITAFPQSDFSILKTSSGVWTAGSTGSSFYAITVSNVGTGNAGNTIPTLTITDPLPSDLSNFVYGGTGWSCGLAGNNLTCTRTDGIANGASYPTIFVTSDIAANPVNKSAVNTATVSGGGEISNTGVSITATGAVRTGFLISNIQRTTGTTTITTNLAHGFTAGQTVIVANATDPSVNGIFTIATVPTTTTFTYTQTGYADVASELSVGTASLTNNVTLTTSTNLAASAGQTIVVTNAGDGSFNGTFTISTISTNTITYSQPGAASSNGFGTVSLPNNPTITADDSSTVTNEYSFTSQTVCANSPTPATTQINGIINDYWPATASVSAGATSITLGTRNASGPGNNIAVGDLVLVIQMQDEDINNTNTSSYASGAASGIGTGYQNLNSTGLYEYMVATSAITGAGGTLTLKSTGSIGLGLLNNYENSAACNGTCTADASGGTIWGQKTFQVVRVPQYGAAQIKSVAQGGTGTLSAAPWNGSSGGIFAVDVVGKLDLNSGVINVQGLGFRGGAGIMMNGDDTQDGWNHPDYRNPAGFNGGGVGTNGTKGEGTAGTSRFIYNASTGTITDNNGAFVLTSTTINSVVRNNGTVTVTTAAAHGIPTSSTQPITVSITGVSDASFNGIYPVASVPSTTTFTYLQAPITIAGQGVPGNSTATVTNATRANATISLANWTAAIPGAVRTSGGVCGAAPLTTDTYNIITGTLPANWATGDSITVTNVIGGGFDGTFTINSISPASPNATSITVCQFPNKTVNGSGTVAGFLEGYPNGSNGRGAPGNAGGGGNDAEPFTNEENSGGGGGSNVGIGGAGGNSWHSNLPVGGYGGGAFTNFINRYVMGGGGGSGTTNNGTGSYGISSISRAGNVVSVTLSDAHPFETGGVIQILGTGNANLDGTWFITNATPTNTTLTYNTVTSGAIGAISAGVADVVLPGGLTGCGTACQTTGVNASGSAGGGLVMIRSGSITGPAAVSATLTNLARSATYSVATTSAAHGFIVGQMVTISGVIVDDSFNGNFIIASVPTTTTFTFHQVLLPVAKFATGGTASVLSTINAAGNTSLNLLNDGGGGGGAGGAIMILGNSNSLSNLNMTTRGGDGGSPWLGHNTLIDRHGPGGGGGGGVMFISGVPNIADVAGGSSGASTSVYDTYGTAGSAGTIINQNGALDQIPGAASSATCAVDLTVTLSNSGPFYSNGTGTFTATAQNTSPNNPVNFDISSASVTSGQTLVTVNTLENQNFSANQVVIISGTGTALDGKACTVASTPTTNKQFTCNLAVAAGSTINATTGFVYGSAATMSASRLLTTITIVSNQDQTVSVGQVIQLSGTGTAMDGNCTVASVTDSKHYTCTSATSGTIASTAGIVNTGVVSVTVALPTVPVQLTPTSASGTGWICNVSGQNEVCTRLDVAQPESTYPPITINVSVGATATTQTDSATATVAGGGEYNTANDTATSSVVILPVTNPNYNPDLVMGKNATPEPVSVSSSLTYKLVTTNQGNVPVTNATMTDVLPSNLPPNTTSASVSYTSGLSGPAGWACSATGPPNGTTIGCNLGTTITTESNNGGTVTVNTSSAHGLAVNNVVYIQGAADPSYNGGPFTVVSVPSGTQFTYTFIADSANGGGGTVTAITYPVAIGSATCSGANLVTVTTAAPHGFTAGQSMIAAGFTPANFNTTANVVTVVSPYQFTYTKACTNGNNTIAGTVVLNIPAKTIAAVGVPGSKRTNGTATINTTAAHGFLTGNWVTMAGITDTTMNGTYIISSVPSGTSFTYQQPLVLSANGTATVVSTFNIGANSGVQRAGTTTTVLTTAVHNFSTGNTVVISSVSDPSFNGSHTIASAVSGTFTFTYSDATSTSGWVTQNPLFSGGQATIAIGSATCNANVVTVTTVNPHGYMVGQKLNLTGFTPANFNTSSGTPATVASVPSPFQFTYAQTCTNGNNTVAGVVSGGVVSATTATCDVTGKIVTVTTSSAHGFVAGQTIDITNFTDPTFNDLSGAITIVSVPTATTFTYQFAAATCTASGNASGGMVFTTGLSNVGVITTVPVTPTVISTASKTVNTASVVTQQIEPNVANNTASFASNVLYATAVVLDSFHAYSTSAGVALEWRTKEELRNLGFNLYRGANSSLVKLNSSPIAGAALLSRWSAPQHTGKTYTWIDSSPGSNGPYWLEDIEVNGSRSLHGPVYLEQTGSVQVAASASTFTPESFRAVPAPQYHPSSEGTHRAGSFVRPPVTLAQLNAGAAQFMTSRYDPLNGGRTNQQTETAQQKQFDLAALPGVKISVGTEGWVTVSAAQLFAAGLDTNTDPNSLQMYAYGVQQPFRIVKGIGSSNTILSPQDTIEFFGLPANTTYTSDHVYWMTSDTHGGQRIGTVSYGNSAPASASSFNYTAERRDRSLYFAALVNGKEDNFFGAIIAGEPVDQAITLNHVDTNSTSNVVVTVSLQGVIADAAHQVTVSLNGTPVGNLVFNGQDPAKAVFNVPVSQINEGTNTVTFTPNGGDNDVSLVDTIDITYPHTLTADKNYVRFPAYSQTQVHISGFTSNKIHVVDVTGGVAQNELIGNITQEGGGYSITVVAPSNVSRLSLNAESHMLIAYSDDAVTAPASVDAHTPSQWHARQIGADMVIVSHPSFTPVLGPLVGLRQSHGLKVAVVPVDQLYDEYNYGEHTPQAIRDMLTNALSMWQTTPRFLLMVGDASVDPRDFLGQGSWDMVPTKIVTTSIFMTASDDWFSDFNDSGFAQIATGRLPARTLNDAGNMVSKIVNYEAAPAAGWANNVLLVSDANNGYNFSNAVRGTESVLPYGINTTFVITQEVGSANARTMLLSAIDQGQLVVTYIGHGTVDSWSGETLLRGDDAATLGNAGHLSVFMDMACLNGLFHDVYTTSLAESLMLAPNGAVGVYASSGLSDSDPQTAMDSHILGLVFSNPQLTLGEAIQMVKLNVTDNDVRRTWIWFGDPAMHLKSNNTAIAPASTKHSIRTVGKH